MSEIGIKELKNSTSRVIRSVEGGERVIVTKRGKPKAVILSIDDVEAFVLANARELIEMRSAGRRDYSAGKSVSLDAL